MKRKVSRVIALLAVLVGALVIFAKQRAPDPVDPEPAPRWVLQDLDGETVRSSDFAGKVVVLNFWATWCPPCRMEIPGFVKLQEELGADVTIVGVSLDQTGVAEVKAFSERMKINYPVVMGNAEIVSDYGGIEAIPTTFIIDRDGQIRNVHRGYLTRGALENAVKPLL